MRNDPLAVAADRSAHAAILDAQGRHTEALVPLREALAVVEAQLGRDHYEVAVQLGFLAAVLERAGDLDGAMAHHRRALEIQRRLLGPAHPDVAETLRHIAREQAAR